MADAAEAGAQTAKAGGHGLGKKLGPLPIWAWAAVVIGTYLLYHYLRSRNTANAATTPGGTAVGGNNAPLGGLQVGPGGQIFDPTTGTIVGSVSGQTSTTTGTTTTTAQGWLAAAQTALQGLGLDNNAINSALNDYVAGQPLQQSEFNIVEEAIKIIGAAPSSLGNPALAKPAPPPPPPPPPTPSSTNNPSGANPPSLGSILPAGDSIIGNVVSVFQTLGGGWVWVTNQGYVYNYNSPYYGGTDNGAVGGPIAANIVSASPITTGPNAGGYQLVASNGDTYNFGPNANYAPK